MRDSLRPFERTPAPGRSFDLPGFFDNVDMETIEVADFVYKIPSVEDIKRIAKNEMKSMPSRDAIAVGDYCTKSDVKTSTDAVVGWVEKGIEALLFARARFANGNDRSVEHELENARHYFEYAQQISKTMSERYHPGADKPEPLNSILG